MSLPGLNVADPVYEAVATTVVELKDNAEWRFEVAFGTKVEVKARLKQFELHYPYLADMCSSLRFYPELLSSLVQS